VESLISLVIVVTIVLACVSVIALAARATGGAGPSAQSQAATIRSATDQVTADLKMALNITSQSSSAITFTVPDRTGSGSPNTITYSWASAGSSLMRQFNGGTAVSIADNVQNFNLSYVTKSATAAPVESAEQLLVSRDWGTSTDIQSYGLASGSIAEYFSPALPANAVTWKITRVKLKLKRNGTKTGTVSVYVSNVDGTKNPTGAALSSATVDISTVSGAAWTWVNLPLTAVGGLTPGQNMSVVALSSTGSTIGYLAYDNKGTDTSMGESTGNSAGAGFVTPVSTSAIEYYVYGTITTQN
jgi:hypothetical protein